MALYNVFFFLNYICSISLFVVMNDTTVIKEVQFVCVHTIKAKSNFVFFILVIYSLVQHKIYLNGININIALSHSS